jgi:hypothetical protein
MKRVWRLCFIEYHLEDLGAVVAGSTHSCGRSSLSEFPVSTIIATEYRRNKTLCSSAGLRLPGCCNGQEEEGGQGPVRRRCGTQWRNSGPGARGASLVDCGRSNTRAIKRDEQVRRRPRGGAKTGRPACFDDLP